MMLKFTIATCIILTASIFLCSTLALAIVMIDKEGRWPESWPEELEAYRKQAETFQVAHGTQETVYEIRFRDRKEFERIWPTILRLKSKGAPITLLSVSPRQEGKLFDNEKPSVRIYCPPYGSDRIRSLGTLSGVEPPWPESIKAPTAQLPEYAEQTEDGNWVPEQEGKPTRVKYRARIDIHLVVDGEIIDLDRIRVPADTPVIDERKPSYKGRETTDIESLVGQIGTATLSQAAQETSRGHARATKASEKNIRPEFWAEAIRKLEPVRVYRHRGNLVVVLSETNGVEEGLYMCIWISSYYPRTGDDGFTFTNLGHSVHKYRRDMQSDSPDPERREAGEGVLFGTVTDQQGDPVANARVFASYAHHGRTDENGKFALRVSPIDGSGSIGPLDFPMFVWAFEDHDPYHVAWTLIRHPASTDRQFRGELTSSSTAHTGEEWDQAEQKTRQYPLVEETHQGVKLVIEDEDDLSRSIPGDPGELFGDVDDSPKVRNIALVMAPASVITGRVTNVFGEPIANAKAQIEMIEMQLRANKIIISSLNHDWKAEAFAITDDYGYYSLKNLPMSWQKVQLRAEADGYCSDEQQFENDGRNKVEDCDFQLVEGD